VAAQGRHQGGGRPRKRERSRGCLADAAELARLCGLWGDFYDQGWDGNEQSYLAEVDRLRGDARDELDRVLADAEQKLGVLHERCAAALETVKALRQKAPQGHEASEGARGGGVVDRV
jgi:hypothetical protein